MLPGNTEFILQKCPCRSNMATTAYKESSTQRLYGPRVFESQGVA